MLLSVVVPCHNEESVLDILVERVFEVIIRIFEVAVKLPAIDFSIHGEKVIHIPGHAKFASDVTNVSVL